MQVKREAKIYPRHLPSGNTTFRVDLGTISGKRVTKDFKTESEAQKFAAKSDAELHKRNLGALQDLAAVQRYEILSALEKLKPYNVTLAEAVDFYIRYAEPPQAAITLEKAIEKFAAEKRRANRRERYIKAALDSYLNPLARKFPERMANEITTGELEKFIFVKGRSHGTVANYIRNLNVFFNFLVRVGHCSLNPVGKIERPNVRTETTAFLSPDEAKAMLQVAYDNKCFPECACMTLVLFCGVRVEEVEKLSWDAINLNGLTVEIKAGIAKKGKRRINPIPMNAYVWLRLAAGSGAIAPKNYDNRLRAIRQKAKIDYVQNAMRHSFASYHLALHENAPLTAMQLGHPNATLLYNTYRELTTKEAARKFWSIIPKHIEELRKKRKELEIDEILKTFSE